MCSKDKSSPAIVEELLLCYNISSGKFKATIRRSEKAGPYTRGPSLT